MKMRETLAVAVFCGALAVIGYAWGKPGLAGAGAMLVAVWWAIGFAYGWWIGSDDEHDSFTVELSRRLQKRRELPRDTLES